MGEMKWTDAQLRAIEFRGGAAIVSAAAGSGKTAVLVERIKRMLTDMEDPVRADELVVTTFTVKAASELKEKLDRALTQAYEQDPKNSFLEAQIMRLADAHISTISSFCLEILRKNAAFSDVTPGFSVLDSSEADLMLSEAVTFVIEEFCEKAPAEDIKKLYDCFSEENDTRIEKILPLFYGKLRGMTDPEKFIRQQKEFRADPDNAPAALVKRYFRAVIAGGAAEIRELFDELSRLGTKANAPSDYLSSLEPLKSIWDGLCEDREKCREVYKKALAVSIPSVPRKTKNFDNTEMKAADEKIKKKWEILLHRVGVYATADISASQSAPVLDILVSLVGRLDEVYSQMKREKGKIDFTDIELKVLDILRDGTNGAAGELSESFSQIIVDEFQDSNEVQYEIFRLISRNKKNLFFVGDVKQSIYHFRKADPGVFIRLTEEDDDFTVIELNRNFRSSVPVIEAVNGIFTGTMTRELGEVEYGENCALKTDKAPEKDDSKKTELFTFCSQKIKTSRENEAAYIAGRIAGMVRDGFMINDEGIQRKCGYNDFAVIMRSFSNYVSIYKKAFEAAGVPYEAKEDGGYTDFAEIKLALSLLRVIDDPYKDKDLTAVMMLPPYMFTADDMARIKLKHTPGSGGKKHRNLWTGLKELISLSDNVNVCGSAEEKEQLSAFVSGNSSLIARAGAFVSEIESYREYAAESSVTQLVRYIYDESLMVPAVTASPDGAKREANLRMLIHYAGVFSGSETGGLCDFINYMESIDKKKIRLAQAKSVSGAGGCVKLMTVHASKGLEFPVCFVSNLSSSRKRKNYDFVICEPTACVGIRYNDPEKMIRKNDLFYDIAQWENERLDLSEEMRLLYVAATRAKEKLIFTAPVTDTASKEMHYGWIMGSSAVKDGLITVTPNAVPENVCAHRQEELGGECGKPVYSVYEKSAFTVIQAKYTATQIGVKNTEKKGGQDSVFDKHFRLPSFLREEETARLTGKKRGDAYHKVMELIDMSPDAGSARSRLDGLFRRGKLNALERDSVSDEDIERFLSSNICKRAFRSGNIKREYPIFCEYPTDEHDLGVNDWSGEEKPFIQGIADMFFVENGEIVLVDYKTNSDETPEPLIKEYKGQLDIYSRALEEATGMRVKERYLYSFRLGEIKI